MRGEGLPGAIEAVVGGGSSPHARGGPPPTIPRNGASAHPRMRGEGEDQTRNAWTPLGSSPHARGGLEGAGCFLEEGGLIPACAGRAS